MANDELKDRVEAIKQLLHLFRMERAVYMGVTVISLIMLLASAGSLLFQKQAGPVELTGLFGSAGAITYTTGRLLRMWSEALRVLAQSGPSEE